jgi:ABC-2 type transport system ATP-binding protein/lipopolysaccharide transport system ATP-binding protein
MNAHAGNEPEALVRLKAASVHFEDYGAGRGLRGWLVGRGRSRAASGYTALREIDLELRRGDRVALIGPNGAGKTTLLRMIAGGYAPTSGSIEVRGRVSAILNLGLFIDPYETGLENIAIGGLLAGMSPAEIQRVTPDIVAFSEIGGFADRAVRTYSSGMQVRLAIAIATAREPDILLIDEGIGLGDARFKLKVRDRLKQLSTRANVLVVASHSLDVLRTFCTKGLFVRDGRIAHMGPLEETIAAYEAWVEEDPTGRKALKR